MLIVLTDGETRDMEDALATQLGQKLKSKKIVLYGISVRSEGASRELKTACEITGGQLFESGDRPGLQSVFRQIDQLQRAQLASAQPQWLQHDRPFAMIGLALLALFLVTILGARFTPW